MRGPRLARENLEQLAPRLRRRATLIVLQRLSPLRQALEQDASLVRTGSSEAQAYGWRELQPGQPGCVSSQAGACTT